jgi:ferredoxin/flavodoxin
MQPETIHLIYFSPTHTTRKTLEAIAEGIGGTTGQTLSLTTGSPKNRPALSEQDLVLVGMPVYSGRLPQPAVKRFASITGNGAAVVPVVVYGNRHYDDALKELFNCCRKQGFKPVAAGAFLGEHSFSTPELPLSKGRPDAADLEKAKAFGIRIASIDAELDNVPGNRPYKPEMTPSGSATSVDPETCTRCGQCIDLCPTQGMTLTASAAQADPENCIWCLACLRHCPVGARTLTHEKVRGFAQKLNDRFIERREPETFFPATAE